MSTELMSLEDQARLELTLRTRENIIKDLLAGGKIPQEMNDRDFLMKALDGMDRTVLSKAKIKSEDSASKTNSQHAANIATLLKQVGTRNKGNRVAPLASVPNAVSNPVPGETDVGVFPLNYEDMTRT